MFFPNSETNSGCYKNSGERTKGSYFMKCLNKKPFCWEAVRLLAKTARRLEGLWWRRQRRAQASQQTEAAFRILPTCTRHRLAAEGALCLHLYDEYAELSIPIGYKYFRDNLCRNWTVVKKKHWGLWNSLACHPLLAFGWTVLPVQAQVQIQIGSGCSFRWHSSLEMPISTSPSAHVKIVWRNCIPPCWVCWLW